MKKIDEEAPTNSAGGGAVAGIGIGPDGEPGVNKKKRNINLGLVKRWTGVGKK